MFKKIIVSVLTVLIINQREIITASNQGFSAEITKRFRNAVLKKNQEQCLKMLNEPDTVAQIDFNHVSQHAGDTLFCEVIDENDFSEDVALKILELRTRDNGLVVDINCQKSYKNRTALMYAVLGAKKKVISKILELKKADGTLLANINLKDSGNSSALTAMVGFWYCETTLDTAENNPDKKSWYAAIIKQLLLLGSDTTNIRTYGSRYTFVVNKTPLQLLAQCSSQPHESILPIFDALKPDIDVKNLTIQESMLLNAYKKFLEGQHDDLRNQLDALKRDNLNIDPSLCAVFKSQSIQPLLVFLTEKRY